MDVLACGVLSELVILYCLDEHDVRRVERFLRGPVRIYVILITLMGLAALALPVGYGMVALGAGLFILSDMILSIRLFRLPEGDPRVRPAAVALWVSYIAGQMLILLKIAPF